MNSNAPITWRSILKGLFNPLLGLGYLLGKLPARFLFRLRLEVNGIDRAGYAYCLWLAALQAKKLGIPRISAIEFGVGQGGGLLSLEKIAEQVTKLTGTEIDIYGFDLGQGLPEPKDYRDLPFIWKCGSFKMNTKKLQEKLKKTTSLILGGVAKTVPQFLKKNISPIGFAVFDLDYYSSTVDALKIFQISNKMLLPRIFCYFDDVIGDDEEIYSQYTGELLAINEFNKLYKNKKLDLIPGLTYKRVVKNEMWYDKIYVLHIFDHELYNSYIHDIENRQ